MMVLVFGKGSGPEKLVKKSSSVAPGTAAGARAKNSCQAAHVGPRRDVGLFDS